MALKVDLVKLCAVGRRDDRLTVRPKPRRRVYRQAQARD